MLGILVPNPRRAIQEQHERFQVGLLIQELNRRHHACFQVIAEPNPPEAIIQSGQTTRWVEVVTTFWNDAYAKDLNSYGTVEEEHAPVGDGPFMNMDEEFTPRFVAAVKSKLEKQNYIPILEKYGQGYLLVSIHNPFFCESMLQLVEEEWKNSRINYSGCFRSVYITFRVFRGYKVKRWKTL